MRSMLLTMLQHAALPLAALSSSAGRYGGQNDTVALQATIDAAAGGGGGVVVLPAGKTFVSWSLTLRSNIVLRIDGTLAIDGDPYASWHGRKALLAGSKIRNTTVTGEGTIQGNGHAWWPLRRKNYKFFAPRIFACDHCEKVTLSQLRVYNTPAWAIGFEAGKSILVDGIALESPHDSPNTDGVDMDCAGSIHEPCVLRNSRIYNGDDEVAVGGANVLVEDCEFGTYKRFLTDPCQVNSSSNLCCSS